MSGLGTADFFYREAHRLGYVARSAFKMQKQYKLIKPGASVLDLGCAPGAWLQVACQDLGPMKNGGVVVGVDLKKVKVPSLHCDTRVRTVCADVMNLPKEQGKGFSVVLSDMCPLVAGITTKDVALSVEVGMRALDLAVGGTVLSHPDSDIDQEELSDSSTSKSDGNEFSQICKPRFRKASWLRPKATRSSSREIYLICQDLW
ncbi:PREDICTED: uncharacterized protein LOC104597163 isoform X2 [Nelumbo nucifera]|uniref:rRNA methyltransferase 2, mitochondrial n=1 Tax=Nelumbo nucifera TaxID=4432 RepID=A0A1U7ZX86_NELNU|nr:PREDICTED: uncharacterized protein LOC104597163 isoform X2 [Nelumbo nucifera]